MKYLFLIILTCLGQVNIAQNTVRPQWFFNEDCVKMKELISCVRDTPLEINYDLSEKAQNNLNTYLYNKNRYVSPKEKWVIMVNGFSTEELMNNLIKTVGIEEVLSTNARVGIYVGRTNFYGRNLLYLYLMIPHSSYNSFYTRTK